MKRGDILLDMLKYKKLIFNDEMKAVYTGNVWIYLEEDYEYIKNKLEKQV